MSSLTDKEREELEQLRKVADAAFETVQMVNRPAGSFKSGTAEVMYSDVTNLRTEIDKWRQIRKS